ncbi:MAG: hypothetical protein ACLSGI_11140 [Butyricicoccaceae bacterium]
MRNVSAGAPRAGKTDIAVLVTDSTRGLQPAEQGLSSCSASGNSVCHRAQQSGFDRFLPPCRKTKLRRAAADSNIRELKELIARAVKPTEPEKRLLPPACAE